LTIGIEPSTRSEDFEVVSLVFASLAQQPRHLVKKLRLCALAGLFFCFSVGPVFASGYAAALLDYQVGRYDAAYQGFMASVAKGDARGRYYIAMMYKDGLGVRQDLGQALTWYGCAVASRAPMAVSARIWRDLLRASLPASVIQQVRVDGRSCSGVTVAGPAVERQVTYREILSPAQSMDQDLQKSLPGQGRGIRGSSFAQVFFWPVEMALRTIGRAAEGRSGVRAASVQNAPAAGPQDPNTVFLAAFCWVILALAAIGLKSSFGAIANKRRGQIPNPASAD
jgi:TPR repeat protein